MAHCHKPSQFSRPTTIACRAENVHVCGFQIAFGFETDRDQGTMTRGAPKQKNVGIFRRLHAVLVKEAENGQRLSQLC
jgi:hypothetical protein